MKTEGELPEVLNRLKTLHAIGIALSAEKDGKRLQEKILKSARELTNADGGTLYLRSDSGDGEFLSFEILITESLGIYQGGTSHHPITYPSLPLHDADGKPNLHMVAVCAVLTGKTLNTADAYAETRFEFSGTRAFDAKNNYRSKAFLTVPMKDHQDHVVGVLQLINPIDPETGEITVFTPMDQQLVESLAAQAAVALLNQRLLEQQQHLFNSFKKLNDIGVALSYEKDNRKLLQMILQAARKLTQADGGTLYTMQGKDRERRLKFEILITESKGIHLGGDSGKEIPFEPLPLFGGADNQTPNKHMVAACAALEKTTINIPDAYAETRFEFSGTRAFDEKNNYRSRSFLTVPMVDYADEVIGVLQLINARAPDTGEIHAFTEQEQELVESLASQAAVAIVNQGLLEEQKRLFEAFITMLAGAIDDKSPYTGGHCRRVPQLTMMIADAVARSRAGPREIREFSMNEAERYELWVAGMLHDCGKIITPEHVMDKSTKLETIYDRIHEVDTRFEVLKRDAEIAMLRRRLGQLENGETPDEQALKQEFDQQLQQLEADREFLRRCNVGGEFMSEELKQRVHEIGRRRWRGPDGREQAFLSENELYNFNITKGTLTAEEREVINYHISATIKMLESLPFPSNLARVPEYAGGHHERMDGKGYPKGLTREQMSLPARLMAIADVFEALTASDRPYKKPMPLSTALTILGRMKLENHIDPDLFNVFVREKVYLEYAQKFLPPSQIDDFDPSQLPGWEI